MTVVFGDRNKRAPLYLYEDRGPYLMIAPCSNADKDDEVTKSCALCAWKRSVSVQHWEAKEGSRKVHAIKSADLFYQQKLPHCPFGLSLFFSVIGGHFGIVGSRCRNLSWQLSLFGESSIVIRGVSLDKCSILHGLPQLCHPLPTLVAIQVAVIHQAAN